MTGPKEGIYLDAALAVIGEQVDERVDELVRRRRLRHRIGIAALSIATVASGSVAAIALTTTSDRTGDAAPALATTAHEIRCVEGDRAADEAYFTARYRTAEGGGPDAAGACAEAWAMLQGDAAAVLDATPDELILAAGELLAGVGGEGALVSDAAFGPVSSSADPAFVACVRGSTTIVLALPSASDATPAFVCAAAGA